jgi:hypothetical protein
MKKMVLIRSLLLNVGPYFQKNESQMVNLVKSSIYIDFSLGVTSGLLYLSNLQMGYGVVKIVPWSLFVVLIRSFLKENLVLILVLIRTKNL